MTDKVKRRSNFVARQRRIAERARSKMLLAGIPTRSLHCDGEGEMLALGAGDFLAVGEAAKTNIKDTKPC